MKNIVIVLLTVSLLLCMVSCGTKKIEYSFEKAIDEHITDGEYNRDVSIFKIKTNSRHEEKINDIIYSVFGDILDDYLDGVAIDWQHLVIDTTWTEKDGVLCITVIANDPNATYIAPIFSQSIYLDLKDDLLYPFEEYAEKVGIDISETKNLLSEVSEDASPGYEVIYNRTPKGLFYRGDDMFLIIQVECLPETGVETYSSELYNYTTGESIYCSSSRFSGFDSIK